MKNPLKRQNPSVQGLITQIQKDLVDSDTPLGDILRKAQVLAYRLNDNELKIWVGQEQNGYPEGDDLPNYRVIQTGSFGTFIDGYRKASNIAIPTYGLSDRLKEVATSISFTSGVRSIEGNLKSEGDRLRSSWPADAIALLNGERGQVDGYQCIEAYRIISFAEVEQILETIRSRLLTFLLELDQLGQYTPEGALDVQAEEVSQMVNNILVQGDNVIVGGGEMTTFDQRNQQVDYQYNAAGDINFGDVVNRGDYALELKKLLRELRKAQAAGVLEDDVAIEAEYHVVQARKEVEEPEPEKRDVLNHLDSAKKAIEGAVKIAGAVTALPKLVEAIGQAAETAQSLF